MSAPASDADAFRAFEVEGWERTANPYDRFFGPITDRIADPLLDAAGAETRTRLLDVGTGPGHIASRAQARGADVTGMDIAAAMIELARRRHPGVAFVQAAAESLPFANGAFDAVVGGFILPHLSRPEVALAEFRRVLAPAGRVALSMWDVPERTRLLGVLVDAVADAGSTTPAGVPTGPPFFRYAGDAALRELLTVTGFDRIQVRHIRFVHRVSSAAALWDDLLAGTVRMSATISGQPPATQSRIRAAFDQRTAPYAVAGGLDLPVSVKVASGHVRGTR